MSYSWLSQQIPHLLWELGVHYCMKRTHHQLLSGGRWVQSTSSHSFSCHTICLTVLSSLFSPGHYCLFWDSMSEITSQLHMLLPSCIPQLFVHYMYSHLNVLYCSVHISAELWAEIVNVVISATYCSKHLKTVFSFMKDIYIYIWQNCNGLLVTG